MSFVKDFSANGMESWRDVSAVYEIDPDDVGDGDGAAARTRRANTESQHESRPVAHPPPQGSCHAQWLPQLCRSLGSIQLRNTHHASFVLRIPHPTQLRDF